MKAIHTISAMISLAATSLIAAPDVDPADHAAHVIADPAAHQSSPKPSSGDSVLAHDLAAMRDKVARLEVALSKQSSLPATSDGMAMSGQPPATGKTGMGKMDMKKKDGMAMKKMAARSMKKMDGMAMKKMAARSMKKMSAMGMMKMDKMKMAGMMGMSPMPDGMQGASSSSALPGFPGASHLYHLGSTGFFLDHGSHIALTTQQTATLNRIKEQTALAASASDRAIEQAEQELWLLTSAGQPDIAAIETKALEIAKIVAKKRVAFIRAVGESAKLLTDDQRKSLTGFAPPTPAMEGM